MSAGPITIAVVSAGLGQPSSTRLLADRLATATRLHLVQEGHEVEEHMIELRPLARQITNNVIIGFPAPTLADAIEEITAADGLIAVTPVFSASYSGLFKSFFDLLEPDVLEGLPVLVAAMGGTARHSLVLDHALRPLFSHLRAVVCTTGVLAAAEDWGGAGDALTDALPTRIDRAAGELAAPAVRRAGRPTSPTGRELTHEPQPQPRP